MRAGSGRACGARLEARKQNDERLQRVLASYTSRVETTSAALESELTELMRDYDTLQEQYTTLLRKSEESKIAVNLERRQIGEQFKIIDGARLPERPISPDRLRMNLMGLAGWPRLWSRAGRSARVSRHDAQDR